MYARYTVTLKTLMEHPDYSLGIQNALSKYPLYSKRSKEEYIPSYIPTREELNRKLLNHYKYREIGFESIERFLDELEIAMEEIMPKYNLLFNSADVDFNIIYNVDYERTTKSDKSGTASSNGSGTTESEQNGTAADTSKTTASVTSTSKEVNSQTPQGELSVTAENIDNVSYADSVKWSKNGNTDTADRTGSTTTTAKGKDTTSSSSNGEHQETESSTETTKGNYGVVSAQELVRKYRETIINIEQMIMEDERITELFMLVY